jgi:hypothetical protein
MPFPSPIPLPPVSDRHLSRLIAVAQDARDGNADPLAAEHLLHALPELLEELNGYRRAAASIRRRAMTIRAAGPNVISLPDMRPAADPICA